MIYDIYVGVDPSINSSGVTLLVVDENEQLVEEHFFIIKPGKLNRNEQKAEQENIEKFEYILYDKIAPDKESNNTENELAKTKNFIEICKKVKEIASKYRMKYEARFHFCQEGISYGSTKRTKSVFDLAGLNFMLRWTILTISDSELIIATPGEIKKFASGNGNCNKETMVTLFVASHKDFNLPKIDDISDAYWMAQFAKTHTQS